MPRNREKQREKKRSEIMLNCRNEFGALDATPFQAVINIKKYHKSIKKYKYEVIK